MTVSASYPFCIATIVTHKAIEGMLNAESEGSTEGSYRDAHPWLVAEDLLKSAKTLDQELPILFASQNEDRSCHFSHWSVLKQIEVVELHRGQWDTRATFEHLAPFNPIWEAIDSVFVKPSQEQLERETREGIRVFRTALDEHHIHPYAICETPIFIVEGLRREG